MVVDLPIFTLPSGSTDARSLNPNNSNSPPHESENSGSGLAIAVGALLDGIPESIAIGISMIEGGAVSWVTVAAGFSLTFQKAYPVRLE